MTNIAAINTEQYGGANNEKLKLKALVRSVGANLQAIIMIHIINCLQIEKGWKSLKKGWKVRKTWPIFFIYILRKKSLDCSKITRSLDEPKNH